MSIVNLQLEAKMKINIKAFALTCGIFWGVGLFLITWWIIIMEGFTGEITLIGKVYRGYSISIAGSFIGFLWAFVDGIIGGTVFGWLYNFLVKRFQSS